jgi:hypothetical protein
VLHGVGPGEAVITVAAEGARPAKLRVVTQPGFTSRKLDFATLHLNDRGQVVGTRGNRVILWTEGVERVVGPELQGGQWVLLNNRGQVAGMYHGSYPDPARPTGPRAFFWDGMHTVDVHAPPGADFFIIRALGDDGAVYGDWAGGNPLRGEAFVWRNGEFTTLPKFGADYAMVGDVNVHGDVLMTLQPENRSIILRGGARTDVGPGTGVSISDDLDLLVAGFTDVTIRANGTVYELAAPRHQAYRMKAINSAGDAVGSYWSAASMGILVRGGAAYNAAGLVVDRQDRIYGDIADINERGQLLVSGSDLLLTPQ